MCFFGGFFVGLPVLWSFLWFRVWDGGVNGFFVFVFLLFCCCVFLGGCVFFWGFVVAIVFLVGVVCIVVCVFVFVCCWEVWFWLLKV